MIGSTEQDAFVRAMRWCSVTTLRKDGSPTSSVVFYAVEGDELIFSTTADRLKARTLGHGHDPGRGHSARACAGEQGDARRAGLDAAGGLRRGAEGGRARDHPG